MVVSSGVGVSSRVQRRGGVGCCRGGVALAEARRVPGGLRPDRRTAGVGFADRGGARAEMRWASERGGSSAATSSDERVSCCDGAGAEAGQLRGRTTTGWRRKHRCGGRRGICDWRRGESGSERNSEEDEHFFTAEAKPPLTYLSEFFFKEAPPDEEKATPIYRQSSLADRHPVGGGALEASLFGLIHDHHYCSALLRDRAEKAKKIAIKSAAVVSDLLEEAVNGGVQEAFLNQKRIELEIRMLSTLPSSHMHYWMTSEENVVSIPPNKVAERSKREAPYSMIEVLT
ncbi:uncharacterized protein LOC120290829 [Eucalyptus grandis]|uniref:uncharacterized protein LOC120290829 n=1 Tax=Eucalyptus grandis TaxID=71139 RepID=UPI00192EBF34|nr:uncharacterized protein LOC120290829 [Eucalyptus grandis]